MGEVIDLAAYKKGQWEDIWGASSTDTAVLVQHNTRTGAVRLQMRKSGSPFMTVDVDSAKSIGLMMALEEIHDGKKDGA